MDRTYKRIKRLSVAGVLVASILILLSSCSRGDVPVAMPREIVDLSPTLRPSSPGEQWGSAVLQAYQFPEETAFDHRITDEPVYVEFSTITLLDHIGPHADAPIHLIPGASRTVEELPLDKFFGPARVLDFRTKPKDEPLLRGDFESASINPDDIVIAVVGYQPPASPEELPSYAYLSDEAAEYLASIPIRAFATDAPSTGSFRKYGALMTEEPWANNCLTAPT